MDKEENKKTKKSTSSAKSKTKKEVSTTSTNKTKKVTTKGKKPVVQASKKSPVKEVIEQPKKEEKLTVKEEEVKVFAKEEPKKEIHQEKISKKELKLIRKKRYIIEATIIAILVFIALILLLNRTFLRTSYKTDVMQVSLPRFTYYLNDKNNTVKFVTLRKSANVRNYFNEYLEGFSFYSCSGGEKTFYYNENTNTLINEIKVDKYFAIKVITVNYDTRSPEEVCGVY